MRRTNAPPSRRSAGLQNWLTGTSIWWAAPPTTAGLSRRRTRDKEKPAQEDSGRGLPSPLLLFRFAIYHPPDSVAVHQHAELFRPECLLDGHVHGSLVRQCVEYPLRFRGLLHVDTHRES